MKIIEHWGLGIPKVIHECENYELKEPELIAFLLPALLPAYGMMWVGNKVGSRESNKKGYKYEGNPLTLGYGVKLHKAGVETRMILYKGFGHALNRKQLM